MDYISIIMTMKKGEDLKTAWHDIPIVHGAGERIVVRLDPDFKHKRLRV
jgi:hypothetical protein